MDIHIHVDLYLINIGLIVGVPVALALVTLGLRRWRRQRRNDTWLRFKYASLKVQAESAKRRASQVEEELQRERSSHRIAPTLPGHLDRQHELPSQENRLTVEEAVEAALKETPSPFQRDLADLEAGEKEFRTLNLLQTGTRARLITIDRLVRVLNIATTVIALIPLGFAVYNLVINNQRQALNFNLLSLATVIITKGGLLLLTFFIKPAVMGASGWVGGQLAKKVWVGWKARSKTKASK